MNVLISGLGRVGLPIACALFRRGHRVTGYDTDVCLVSELKEGLGRLPWEPDLRILGPRYVHTLVEFAQPDVAYIIVPTPEENGRLSSKYVIQARDEIRRVYPDCFIVVGSTLDPADVPLVFTDQRMAYSPPLIRLGSVVNDVLKASLRLVGVQTKSDVDIVREFWDYQEFPIQRYSNSSPKYIIGDPLSIAVAKLAINTSLSLKVAWANEVYSVVQALGANPKVVVDALHSESRIQVGERGWPPGGPCLPRDVEVWTSMASSPLVERAKVVHKATANKIIADTVRMVSELKNPRTAVLGVAYNPNALDITNSQGLAIADELFSNGYYVRIYDPAFRRLVPEAHRLTSLCVDLKHAMSDSNVVIIATPWDEFKTLDYTGKFVIDLTRQ